MIDLNPLVIERHFINPPSNVEPDEKDCVWYSMTDKIDYLPGGKVSGDVSYTCAFHDLSNGIQTHCRAPLGVDIREKWTLNGSLPGEPPEPTELGIGAPASGLYIREDVDLRCNVLMTKFVKKNLKKSHAALVDKLVEKAREASAQRMRSATGSGRLSPPSIAQAMSQPWSPPTHPPTTQGRPHQGFHGSYICPQKTSHQEATSPSARMSTQLVETHQPLRDPSIRYSQTSSHRVPPPYRAPSQHSSQAQYYPECPPALYVPSQQALLQAQSIYDCPSTLRSPQPHSPGRIIPPYPDDEDFAPAPLRIGSQDHGANTGSMYTPSFRSRSSSEFEHPMYPHLSPYSSVFTERSSSPDEPRTPESATMRAAPRGYFEKTGHPDVLRPGYGRLVGRSNGSFTAELD